jgi:hypothetical protein
MFVNNIVCSCNYNLQQLLEHSYYQTLVFHTGFCILDFFSPLQTHKAYATHNSVVYILPKTVQGYFICDLSWPSAR